MGMFDEINCEWELPHAEYQSRTFQTKDTPAQSCDVYRISEDGFLWHEAYEVEDKSNPNATGLERHKGCMTRVNKRWERERFTGEVVFYTFHDEDQAEGWIEYSAYFVDGKVENFNVLKDSRPTRSD